MRKAVLWAIQAAVALVVALLVWRQIARHWEEFRSLQFAFTPRPGWIAGSFLVVFVTYAIQIESWRRILAGWGQTLPYGQAGRIWLLANLGRYIPGKIWSVAGLVVMAQQAGVAPWAAAASAVAIQATGLGMATVVIVAGIPGATSPLQLLGAAAITAATAGALCWERPIRLLGRIAGLGQDIRPLPVKALLRGASLTLASWLTYGLSFWMLARGLGLPDSLPFGTAAGVFALGYMLGLLALFAPGGVVVREVTYVGLLVPWIGRAGAVALSVSSRIQLTLTEVAAPLVMLALLGILKHRKASVESHATGR